MSATDTAPRRPTWQEIVALEPRLPVLVDDARRIRRPTWNDYARLKNRLSSLVGWDARPGVAPLLRTTAAYDVCIDRLIAALRL